MILDNEKLGSGAFAIVYQGILKGRPPVFAIHPKLSMVLGTSDIDNVSVAVKQLKPHATDVER